MAWFRFYDEALDDPKVQSLSPVDFKYWINLLCIAKRYNGRFPTVSETAFLLRLDEDACRTVVRRLADAGLIDSHSGGPNGFHDAPHNWEKRQYKSDTSTERVKRFRKRYKLVTETADETGPETDADTEAEEGKEPTLREDKSSLRFGKKSTNGNGQVKGSRLPDGWKPRTEDAAFVRSCGLTDLEIGWETDKFTDYWLAKSGSRATMLDWNRTWLNWMRKAIDEKDEKQRRDKRFEERFKH